MSALEDLNRLSRKICEQTPDFDLAQRLLSEMKASHSYPKWLPLTGSILGAGSFAMLFGGSIRDGLSCAMIGLLLGFLSEIKHESMNALAKTLILSFIAGIMSYITVFLGLGKNVDMIMIGSIMLLIPGLAFGNALRDLLGGDVLTGMLKTVQSCLTALLIACGFSGAMLIMAELGIASGIPAAEHGFLAELIMAILGTIAFSCIFKVRPDRIWFSALGGCAVYAVYRLCEYLDAPSFAAAFFCAIFGTAFAELCARICRTPAIVFLTPAIIPIVPGSSLYYAMSALIDKNGLLLLDKASQTLYISAGLVVGMMLVTMITPLFKPVRGFSQNKRA